MRVAYYSPLPPERSGIADYSALLLPALRKRIRVTVVPRRARRPPRADIALYHVGNDPEAHGWIVEALRRRPGVVVLHDFVLHHLVAGLTLGRGDGAGYLDAMEREAGVPGRLLAHGVIDARVPPLWESRPQEFPLAGEVLRHARGLIVHSHYVGDRARAAGYRGPLWRIAHPAWPVPSVAPPGVAGDPLIGCFGHVNASKRVPQLLEAFARLRSARPGARLLLVGAIAPRFRLRERIERLGIPAEALRLEGYVGEGRLWSLMAACDVCVSLRHPTMGETSGSALRALSLARPLVVSDEGWFSELPDDVALKVPVDAYEVDVLAAALGLIAADGRLRAAMAQSARRYVDAQHDLEDSAESYTAALELAAGGEAVDDATLLEVASAALESGLGRAGPELTRIAGLLGEVGVGS